MRPRKTFRSVFSWCPSCAKRRLTQRLMLISSAANHCLQLIWSGLTPKCTTRKSHFQNNDCLFTNVNKQQQQQQHHSLEEIYKTQWLMKVQTEKHSKEEKHELRASRTPELDLPCWDFTVCDSATQPRRTGKRTQGRRRLHTLGDEHRCTQSGLGGPIGKEGQAGWHVRDQSFQNKAGSDEEINRN